MSDPNNSADTLQKFETFLKYHKTPEDVVKGYAHWAQNGAYDEDFVTISHRGHVMVADILEDYYPYGREQIYILDIAAGTGRVGKELLSRGFARIDALDPCLPMLEEAKKKNVYQKFFQCRIDGEPLDIPEETYDAISCSAAFVDGHLPAESIIELLRLVKTGGVIAMVGGAEWWDTIPEYHVKMAALIQKLEEEKQMKVIRKERMVGFVGQKYQAVAFVFKKL